MASVKPSTKKTKKPDQIAARTYRKHLFDIPDDIIYLDGNSLGPLPTSDADRVQQNIVSEWGGSLINGWNEHGWMEQSARIGNTIGKLIGAPQGSVMMGDTLFIKVYPAFTTILEMRPGRKVVLSDRS